MPDIISVIEALVRAAFIDKRILPRISKTEQALLIFAALCTGAGIFFLALALYQYLESIYAPHTAALISCALVFAAAILAMLLKEFIRSKKASGPQPAHDAFSENIHVLIKEICNELEEPIRENPKTSVALAALAGLLTARRI